MTLTDSTYTALLASVLHDPDDDAPRLILADWLDEHEQPERAELIRVQVELARCGEPPIVINYPEAIISPRYGPNYFTLTGGESTKDAGKFIFTAKPGLRVDVIGRRRHGYKRTQDVFGLRIHKINDDEIVVVDDANSKPWEGWALQDRSHELLREHGERWAMEELVRPCGYAIEFGSAIQGTTFMRHSVGGRVPELKWHWSRGFISRAECSTETLIGGWTRTDYLAGRKEGIAAELSRSVPVTEVVLTDKSVAHHNDGGTAFWYYEPGYNYEQPRQIPWPIAKLLDQKSTFIGGLMVYPFLTPDRAVAALSKAAAKWCRKEAGLA